MIVLHVSLSQGRMLLWGETPVEGEAKKPAGRSGRQPKTPRPQPLPFAAPGEELASVLHSVLHDGKPAKTKGEPVFLWLPTVQGMPVASSPLIAPPPEPGGAAQLAPWQLEALSLTTSQVMDLLAACLDQTALAPGVLVGSALAFWATALRFAGALAAREQFLPDIDSAGAGWRAAWKP